MTSILIAFPADGLTVKYQTVEDGKQLECTATVTSTVHIDVVAYTDILFLTPDDNSCAVASTYGVVRKSYTNARRTYRVMGDDASIIFDNVQISVLSVNNLLRRQEGFTSKYSVGYYTLEAGEIVRSVEENISLDVAVFNVIQNTSFDINYIDIAKENDTENLVAAVNGVGCVVVPTETYAHIMATEAVSSFDIHWFNGG